MFQELGASDIPPWPVPPGLSLECYGLRETADRRQTGIRCGAVAGFWGWGRSWTGSGCPWRWLAERRVPGMVLVWHPRLCSPGAARCARADGPAGRQGRAWRDLLRHPTQRRQRRPRISRTARHARESRVPWERRPPRSSWPQRLPGTLPPDSDRTVQSTGLRTETYGVASQLHVFIWGVTGGRELISWLLNQPSV